MISKRLLVGGLLLGGLTAYFLASPSEAAAASEPEPIPPPPANPVTPGDGMPWMVYSEVTLERQGEYNDWAPTHGYYTIKEDGILGPQTCAAFINWWSDGNGPSPPQVCRDAALQRICADAATYKAEYDRLEAMFQSGDPFYEKEQQDAVYIQWQRAAARCNQGI
jgi:hypothetical protein